MVLSTDQIKKETDFEMDLNSDPSSDTSNTPQDLSMKSTDDSQPALHGRVGSDDVTANDSRNRPDQENSRKLTNFFIADILRSDFGPKRTCCHNNRYNDTPSLLSTQPVGLSPPFSSPILSRSLSAIHPAKLGSSLTKPFRTDILTPPPSSPESSSSSLSLSSGALPLLSPLSSITSPSRQSSQSPKKEAQSSSGSCAPSSVKTSQGSEPGDKTTQLPWPAWVYCTRYSDRPSSGPRYRKPRQGKVSTDKRPRTAFSTSQLQRLRTEFQECPYLSETRRLALARELGLSESQVKIWFQNKRAKLKKGSGVRNPLAQLLMEEGLYNHSTIVVRDDSNSQDKQTPAQN